MSQISRIYRYGEVDHPATITYKRIRHIILHAGDADGRTLEISAPNRASLKEIDQAVTELLPRLLKSCAFHKKRAEILPYGPDFTYILGSKNPLTFSTSEERLAYLKENALPLFTERVRYYEALMGVKPAYKVRVRSMSSRFGVNSKRTHTITLQAELYHYSLAVIDSVVVHELAHHFVFDHSERFYRVVYQYCPDYRALHAKLRKHIYA